MEKVKKNLSKILNAEDAGDCQAWSLPAVGDSAGSISGNTSGNVAGNTPGNASGNVTSSPYMTADQLEKIQKQAFDEAYQQGLQQGRQTGEQELQEKIQAISKLLDSLTHPLQQMSEQVEGELVELCIAMVKQLVRRELKLNPGQVVAVVREALAALPVSSRNIQVRLNPADIAIVKAALGDSTDEQGWRIIDDPVISRGGCRVTTETSTINNTVDAKIAQLIAQVFGDQRATDDSEKKS